MCDLNLIETQIWLCISSGKPKERFVLIYQHFIGGTWTFSYNDFNELGEYAFALILDFTW